MKMVKYITYIELTLEFLRLSMEDRQQNIRKWIKTATKYGLKILFYGVPLGVSEHAVCVFESKGDNEKFFIFQREWLGLGTPDAGKLVHNIRTITVH
jgi:hypothetical protein